MSFVCHSSTCATVRLGLRFQAAQKFGRLRFRKFMYFMYYVFYVVYTQSLRKSYVKSNQVCLFFARCLRKFFAHVALKLRKLCTNHKWIADKERNKCVHVRFTNDSRMVYIFGFFVDFRVLCVVYSFVNLWWFICDTCTYSIFFFNFSAYIYISTYLHKLYVPAICQLI